jgi:succinyl-CoA synthetase alpha subunit
MGILIDKETVVLVQGMTGKEGQKAAAAMMEYGTKVAAGVRPGKGGEIVQDRPIYNTVQEAVDTYPSINTSSIYVPPFAARDAILEAINAGIKTINTIIERIPIKDTALVLAAAKERGSQIIGPSSLGCITPGVGRLGVVGGPKKLADEIYTPGSIGIISRSGGMTNELSWQVCKEGLGQSTAVHVGGDFLMGTTYADLLRLFEDDDQTKGVILFGEHGGSYEFEIIDLIKNKEFTKPLAVYVGGKFASSLPEGMNIGHAGAIVARGQTAEEKEEALAAAGVMIAESYQHLVELIKPFA